MGMVEEKKGEEDEVGESSESVSCESHCGSNAEMEVMRKRVIIICRAKESKDQALIHKLRLSNFTLATINSLVLLLGNKIDFL